MILVGAAIFVIGLICLLSKRNFIGVLVGGQLIIIGIVLSFVVAGFHFGGDAQAQVFAFFVLASGAIQLTAGLALAVRVFGFKEQTGIESMTELRN